MRRTHYAGSLRETHVGEEVVLEGWVNRRRDLGGLIFLDLRDREGLVQLVAHPASPAYATAERVRSEGRECFETGIARRGGLLLAAPPTTLLIEETLTVPV